MKKKYILIGIIVFLFSVIVGFFIYRNFLKEEIETNILKEKEDIPKVQEEHYELSLFMVGDALYHDGVYKDGLQGNGTYSFTKNLELIKPIVANYDLAYYNQESILGGTELGLSTYPRFNSPKEVGDAFLDAGFNLVSTANNHTLDRGEQAILSSYSYWSQKEYVLMSGTCDSFTCTNNIPVGEINHISYAFLSYTTLTNGLRVPTGKEYLVNLYSESRVKEDISKVQDQVDVVIVAMHWGSEYRDYPVEEQRQIANYLASLGVTVVIGTHPHVIQPIEMIGDTLVFYSLGNFISAQTGIDKLVGLAAGVGIKKDVVNGEKTISISNVDTMLTYTYYNKSFRDFKVIPFTKLDSSILTNYKTIEEKKKSLVMAYGMDVNWMS